MNKELEKIQEEKTREAQELFEKYEITPKESDDYFSVEIPSYTENTNPEEKESNFHWTRLSINSNIGCVID